MHHALKMQHAANSNGNLFLFLMDFAWRCRFSLPILLAGSMALIGHACVLHINISTHTVRDNGALDDSSDSDGSIASSEMTPTSDASSS